MPLSSSPHFQGHSAPCLGCFIIYNCSTSQTSIKHLMSTTAFFFIQVVSCVTITTTHFEKLSFWFSLRKISSFLLLPRLPLFLSNRKLVCCLGTWTSGVNTKFNLVLLTNQQSQEQVGWISFFFFLDEFLYLEIENARSVRSGLGNLRIWIKLMQCDRQMPSVSPAQSQSV